MSSSVEEFDSESDSDTSSVDEEIAAFLANPTKPKVIEVIVNDDRNFENKNKNKL